MTVTIADVDVESLFAFVVVQILMYLYGPGLRRPFGSLKTIRDLPESIRNLHWPVIAADVLFVHLMIIFWAILFTKFETVIFAGLFFLLSFIGYFLSEKITIVPSFIISISLAIFLIIYFSQTGYFQQLFDNAWELVRIS